LPNFLMQTVTANESSIQSWVERVRSGDPRALARAITAIENGSAESGTLLRQLFAYSGKARIIGITGAPGAGKSTLVDQLAREYRRQQRTVGIVAVDPTSPFSGGAILGDRIRMLGHYTDSGIFIRSMATRGFLGGLARATTDVVTALDASGKDVILIETVGVGQDEVDVVRLADITVLILVPGMGDDVQSIKAGIMEIADIFVINKSDREGADRVEREIRAMQSLALRKDQWTPPITKTVATEGKGIAELAAAIVGYETFLQQQNLLLKKKISNWRERLVEMLRDTLLDRLLNESLAPDELSRLAAEVADHRSDPYSLVEEIIGKFCRSGRRVLGPSGHRNPKSE
jgi:LAO/AO transport system kinase